MFIDTEELVVAYLQPLVTQGVLAGVSVEMDNDSPMPFALVTRTASNDNKVTELATCDVDVFATDRTSANDVMRRVHAHMLTLTSKIGITLSTGVVSVDLVRTIQGPAWANYDDENLERYISRYEVESRFNSQPLQ